MLEEIEPWGEKRADYRAAVICWVIASVNTGKGSRPRLKEFLKLFDFEPEPEQSDEELSLIFDRIAGRPGKKKKK